MEESEPVKISEDFISRKSKLVKQTSGAIFFRSKRVLRNILIAAIITALLASSVMAIPSVREAIIEFILQIKDDRIAITFDTEEAATAPLSIETIYSVNFIPSGYELAVNDCAQNQKILGGQMSKINGSAIISLQFQMMQQKKTG